MFFTNNLMGSITVDLKLGEWKVNDTLHPMLGGRIPQVNGQDQMVQSGNYCFSSIRMVFLDETKIPSLENFHDYYSSYMSKPHRTSCG